MHYRETYSWNPNDSILIRRTLHDELIIRLHIQSVIRAVGLPFTWRELEVYFRGRLRTRVHRTQGDGHWLARYIPDIPVDLVQVPAVSDVECDWERFRRRLFARHSGLRRAIDTSVDWSRG